MHFIFDKFQSFFFLFLLTTHQINDFNFKYNKLNYQNETSNNVSNNESNENNQSDEIQHFLNICYHKMNLNNLPCSITLVPCGDITDWKVLDPQVIIKKNNSYFSINNYESLISLRKKITDNLNQVSINLRKSTIINLVQEKKLGRNGNSYYYQKIIRKFDIPDNVYVSFENKYNLIPNSNSDYKCNYLDVTFYDSSRNLMMRKSLPRDFIENLKKEYPNLFRETNSYRSKIKIKKLIKNSTNFCFLNDEHPILRIQRDNFKFNKSKNDKYSKKHNQTIKLIRFDDVKFFYKFNSDRIAEINQLFKSYMRLSSKSDNLFSYAIIQEKTTGEIYMHIRTNSGMNYLNHLESISNQQNNFVFRFKKSNSLTLRIKSLESWNILRYEINVPNPNCSVMAYNNKNSIQHNYLNSYVDPANSKCDGIDEKSFFEDLNYREPINKYKEFYAILSYENRVIFNYDKYKCILIEYFGKILTCDGKVLSIEEYGHLRSKNLNFIGLILLNHGRIQIVRVDDYGNVLEFKDAINTRPHQTSTKDPSYLDSQVCHECAKLDLRTQVETSLAYNQYKKAIKIQSEGLEKYVILFLIFLVLSMFWFKKQNRKRKMRI